MPRISSCWITALIIFTSFFATDHLSASTCPEVEPAAAEIIKQAIAAHGGKTALRSIHTQREIGKTTIYLKGEVFRESDYLSLQQAPDKFYKESPTGLPPFHEKLIFATDGKTSWTQNDGALAPYALPPEESFPVSEEAYPYFFTLCERGVRVIYQGAMDLDGESVHHLSYIFADERVEDAYFEAGGGLLREVSRNIQTSQGPALSRRRWLDYRPVSGVLLAHRQESIFPPDEHHVSLISKLEINVELADHLFQLPPRPVLGPEHLQRLAGRFRASDQVFIIVHSDAGLTIELPGKAPEVMIPVTPERFLFHDGRGPGSAMGNVRFDLDVEPDRLVLRLRQKDVAAEREGD